MEWSYNASDYEEKSFEILPQGDYRVRIEDTAEKVSKGGNEMIELTLAVNGSNAKLWHLIVLMRDNPKLTNQKLGEFFKAFGITDQNINNHHNWIGKVAGARVKHDEYNGYTNAKVHYWLDEKRLSKLKPWEDPVGADPSMTEIGNDLPF